MLLFSEIRNKIITMKIIKSPWLYVVIVITLAAVFLPDQYKKVSDKITSFLIAPFLLEFSYVLIRNKKIKEEFSIRRLTAFLFLYLVIQGIVN